MERRGITLASWAATIGLCGSVLAVTAGIHLYPEQVVLHLLAYGLSLVAWLLAFECLDDITRLRRLTAPQRLAHQRLRVAIVQAEAEARFLHRQAAMRRRDLFFRR